MILVGKDPQGETLGTRIGRIDLSGPDGGQVLGISSVDPRHVITVDTVSSEHPRPKAVSGELMNKDLDCCIRTRGTDSP